MKNIIKENLQKKIIMKAWKIEDYIYIMENLRQVNVFFDDDFHKKYNSFYKVRRNADWRKIYFNFLENNKLRNDLTFEEVLKYIYNETGFIEASFASKLLATINPNMPIWDKNVLNYFKIKFYTKKTTNKIDLSIKVYDDLCIEYKKMLEDQQVLDEIKRLKGLIENYSITNTKILDFIIWTLGDKMDLE